MPTWCETLDRLREGDVLARDRVARLVIGALRSLGAYRQRESWDDVVQDVLVALLQHGPRSDSDAAVAAWIRRAALNRFVDLVRKEQGRRRSGAGAGAGWRQNVSLEEAPLRDETALDESLQQDLAGALDALVPRQRRVIESKYALGCTDSEGAARLGESLGTYKRLVRQALAALRAALVDDPKGEPHGPAGAGGSDRRPVPSEET